MIIWEIRRVAWQGLEEAVLARFLEENLDL